MNIGKAKMAFGMSVKLIDDFIKGLYENKLFPRTTTLKKEFELLEGMRTEIEIQVDFGRPEFVMEWHPDGYYCTILNLRGNLVPLVRFAGHVSPELFSIPFYVSVQLDLILDKAIGRAPFLKLEFGGVRKITEPFPASLIEDFFNSNEVKVALQRLNLDIVEPLIQGLETVYYFDQPEDQRPAHHSYDVYLQLLPARQGYVDSFALTLDLPPFGDYFPLNIESFVPASAEFMAYVSPEMIQLLVEKGKSQLSVYLEKAPTVSMNKLELELDGNAIKLDAKFHESDYDVDGTIKGKIKFRHAPGLNLMLLDGTELKVDVDFPWWLDVALFFYEGITGNDLKKQIEQDMPDLAQLYISNIITSIISKFSAVMDKHDFSAGGVPVYVYTDTIKLDGNAIYAYVQVLIIPRTERLKRADYSKILRKFVIFHLESGRSYMTEDLANFMQLGLIVIPGFHQVDGKYISANPDDTEANNLLEMWGR